MKTFSHEHSIPHFSRVENCRVCHSDKLREVISLGEQPLANSLTYLPVADAMTAPLELIQCHSCRTVQLGVDVDANLMFSNYLWVTGTSPTTVRHCDWIVQETLKRATSKPSSVLEIASNDGTLLSAFRAEGVSPLGIDPAENLAQITRDKDLQTIVAYFSRKVAEDLVSTYSVFDVVVARNVLSHVPDPQDLVYGISSVLSRHGIAVIEFHRADIILEQLHYDSIYHEHSLYHSFTSMSKMLQEAGLRIFDAIPTGISGGSWLIFACHQDCRRESDEVVEATVQRENQIGVGALSKWRDFSNRVASHKATILEFMSSEVQSSRKIMAYGASARSSTLMNYWFYGREVLIEGIIDSSPLKQGKYSPGLGVPILSLEEALRHSPDTILLLAFNFEAEIRNSLQRSGWRGRLARVLPEPFRVEEFG